MKNYPIEFVDQIEAALGDQARSFFASLEVTPPVSFLSNPNKLPAELINGARSVPWCPYGYYLNERPEFIFEPSFHAGAYYVMEASSMMIWQALDTLLESNQNLRILDLCGAPGGKAMVAANFIGKSGLLVVNEVNRSRYQVLKENVAKWGMPNIYVSNYDPSRIALDNFFDCVIVDAPCSGEGLFRKTPESVSAWSKTNVTHCSMRQKRILNEASRMVRHEGFLLYSTCTYNNEENIDNTKYLCDKQGFTSIRLKLNFSAIEQKLDGCYGYQCFPHLVEGEGFYMSALKRGHDTNVVPGDRSRIKSVKSIRAPKKDTDLWKPFLSHAVNYSLFINEAGTYYAVPNEILQEYLQTIHCLPHGSPVLVLGQIKGKDIVPHHNLALSNVINEEIPRIELSQSRAIAYLRKDVITDLASDTIGWHLASYNGNSLGWFKQTSRHLKNYFPTNLRIRKRE